MKGLVHYNGVWSIQCIWEHDGISPAVPEGRPFLVSCIIRTTCSSRVTVAAARWSRMVGSMEVTLKFKTYGNGLG